MVLETSLIKLDGAYRIPNIHIRGHLCKTNLQTNTAYRGFGAPQMIIFMETLMREISNLLAIDPVEVRRINMYKEGSTMRQLNKLRISNSVLTITGRKQSVMDQRNLRVVIFL